MISKRSDGSHGDEGVFSIAASQVLKSVFQVLQPLGVTHYLLKDVFLLLKFLLLQIGSSYEVKILLLSVDICLLLDNLIVSLSQLLFQLCLALVRGQRQASLFLDIPHFDEFQPFFFLEVRNHCSRLIQLPLAFIDLYLLHDLFPLMRSLRLFDRLFQQLSFYNCLQPISLDLVIKAFLEVGAISLLEHPQIALKHVDSLCEVDWSGRLGEGSKSVSSAGVIRKRMLFRVADDEFKGFAHLIIILIKYAESGHDHSAYPNIQLPSLNSLFFVAPSRYN